MTYRLAWADAGVMNVPRALQLRKYAQAWRRQHPRQVRRVPAWVRAGLDWTEGQEVPRFAHWARADAWHRLQVADVNNDAVSCVRRTHHDAKGGNHGTS